MNVNETEARKRTMRPTTLTPKVHKAIVKALRAGNTLAAAAASVGIDPAQVNHWMRRGVGTDKLKRKPPYIQFSRDIKKARAAAQIDRIAIIQKSAKGGELVERRTTTRTRGDTETTDTVEKFAPPQWQAAAWHCERSDPDHWALKDRKELAELRRQLKEMEKEIAELRSGKTEPPPPEGQSGA